MQPYTQIGQARLVWILLLLAPLACLFLTPAPLRAQSDVLAPRLPGSPTQDWQRDVQPASRSAAPEAIPPLGAPGLSYRYVGVFGENRVAYFEDSAHLNFPIGLTTDGGNVWISEVFGRRLMKYTNSGQFVMQIGQAGISDMQGISVSRITDVAVDAGGNIWTADENTARVLKFDAGGRFVAGLGSQWNCGNANDQFCYPISVAFDGAGRIYVSDGGPYWNFDQGNHRIQIFNPDGSYLATIGNTGNAGSGNLQFHGPRRMVISGSTLYIADAGNHRVQIIDISNPIAPVFVASIGVTGESGNDNGHLGSPSGVAVDANHVFVADTWNNRVQVFDRLTRAYVATLGGTSGTGNNQFKSPTDVAVDNAGNLFVADWSNKRVQQFDGNRQYVRTLGTTGVPYATDGVHFYQPRGVAVAEDGSVYITEESGNRLVKLDAAGQAQWTVGSAGTDGGWDGNNALLNAPDGVALDRNNRVFVADKYNNRVQVFSTDGAYLHTLGQAGSSGTDNAHFNTPRGIGVGPNGYIYVADTDNHRIQIFDGGLNYLNTLGVTGQSGTDNAHFNRPYDVVVDGLGGIYVADTGNSRIQVFDANRNYVRTLGVTGAAGNDFTRFQEPGRLAVDEQRRLYVADGWNSRIQVFDAGGAYLTTIGGGSSASQGDIHGAFSVAVDRNGNVYAGDFWDNHRVQKFAPGVPGWIQRNINGFGERWNRVTTLASFAEHLYAGTYNWTANGAQIWRMDAAGAWSPIVTDGFGVAHNLGVDHLVEFKGQLYAGTWSENITTPNTPVGAEIWRTANGTNWEQVASDGLGNPYSGEFFRLGVFDDQIFAGTWSYTTTQGAEVWQSITGNAGDWTRIAADGIGDPANGVVLTMESFADQLYVGTRSHLGNGADIWRYDGSVWTAVITDGFGYSGTYDISALEVFGEYLYAGTGRFDAGSQTYPGGQLWRCALASGCDAPGDWTVVVADGFGKAANLNITALQTFQGSLYAVVSNFETGVEVWRSPDGERWGRISFGGFGDSNNRNPFWDNATIVFDDNLYVGTVNNASGGDVWEFLHNKVYLPSVRK